MVNASELGGSCLSRRETDSGRLRSSGPRKAEGMMPGTAVIVILVMALLGVLPRWSHSQNWGHALQEEYLMLVIVCRPNRPH